MVEKINIKALSKCYFWVHFNCKLFDDLNNENKYNIIADDLI